MTRLTIHRLLPLVILCAPAVCSAGSRNLLACTDYHCDDIVPVTLHENDWKQVRELFSDAGTPAQERRTIRQAVALLEDQVGRKTGTWRDLGKNVAGAGKPGQLDCIAESKNTTSYLQLMQEDGLLHWHRVHERAMRHPWILDFHWTAVIEDRTTGIRYAVDSWYLDNGQLPYIQKLDEWMVKRSFGRQTGSPDS